MFVVSNLWISFEKQSAWKTEESSLVTKGLRSLVTSGPRTASYRPGASLWGQYFLRDTVLAPKGHGRQHAYHLTRGRQSPFLLIGVLSLPAAFLFIWCSVPLTKALLLTFTAEPCLHSMQRQKKGALTGQSKLVLLRPPDER